MLSQFRRTIALPALRGIVGHGGQKTSGRALNRTAQSQLGSCWHMPKNISISNPMNSLGGSIRRFHGIGGASARDMAELEDRVSSAVGSTVKDPELNVDLQSLGWMTPRLAISEDETVQILLKPPTLLHPSLTELKDDVKKAAEREIGDWAADKGISVDSTKVNVEAIPSTPIPYMATDEEDLKEIGARLGPGLTNVAHILAVYSCKGGVGKSTVAVNLAYELANMGGRVGLLDLDVYGPSLPVLVKPDNYAVRPSPLGKGMVYPIEHQGVKMLSLGFVSSKSGVPGAGPSEEAAVLRGPMAGRVVNQLLKGTDWGDLDVLVLDLPPGTGDVQLTVCQDVDLSGAVGVTTPSKLALTDARKGIQMFSSLGIPTMALVENMSYFECEGGGIHFPFGKGIGSLMEEDVGLSGITNDTICQLPISTLANDANDSGVPLCLARPKDAGREIHAFSKLAKLVSRELLQLPYRVDRGSGEVAFEHHDATFSLSSIELSKDQGGLMLRAFSEDGAVQQRISPSDLRNRDPQTGERITGTGTNSRPSDNNDDSGMVHVHKSGTHEAQPHGEITPTHVEKKAKVGFEVTWSDGSKFIYTRRAIALAAGGTVSAST